MKEVSEKIIKKIFINVVKAIITTVYFLALMIAYAQLNDSIFKRVSQVATMLALFVSIYLFERAYRKDKDETALEGIEILIIAMYTVSINYIIQKFNFEYRVYVVAASYVFDIYFILKSIFVYTKGRKELADSFSDIKEIVKKEKPIKKEAVRHRKPVTEKKEAKKIKTKSTTTTTKKRNNKKEGKKK